jgi:hypothetical protein
MKKSNFALRLSPSLMDEARKIAESEGVAVNQLINIAVAEKVSALRTSEFFAERAAKGSVTRALGILERAGVGNAPESGDELTGTKPSRVSESSPRYHTVSPWDKLLRNAIATRHLVEFTYNGKRRVAEPHDYGIYQEKPRLLVYQLEGSTPGWKLLDVAKITHCSVSKTTFPGSRGASHQRHLAWDVVFARVA